MAYVTTSVDIEMDDIDTPDLVDEVCKRIDNGKHKPLSPIQKEKLRFEFKELAESLFSMGDIIKVDSLEDRMKYEHLASVWNKYSSTQMQNLLP